MQQRLSHCAAALIAAQPCSTAQAIIPVLIDPALQPLQMQLFMLVATSIILILHDSWPIVWEVTGVVGFVVLAALEALNVIALLSWAGSCPECCLNEG